ncbi:MAG: amidohydrolase [Chlorobi bacterium]|nr:amidohydrolase [Chlorobiota bacterium]
MDIKQTIKQLSEDYFKEIRSIRRHLHQFPELSFEEYKTSEFIQNKLDELDIKYEKGFVKTGIVARIEGKNPAKKVVALRADMDALPIAEQNNVSYKSKIKNVMHACGHDIHSASLLGTIKILNEIKDSFEGTVLFIFQPGEERVPGGAKLMLAEGALNNPKPGLIIGQHVMPTMNAGTIGFKKGKYMASSDEIYITISGKGGHGAMPEQNTDTVLIASHIIVSLQQIVSRNANPTIPTVLSFGKVIANGATNVMPDVVKIEGTFRTMDETWRRKAHLQIEEIAKSIAKGMGAECDIKILNGFPLLVNNEDITEKSYRFAEELLGSENVIDMDIRMTAEDFAYYSQCFPATFYRLGVKNKNTNFVKALHSSNFDIDEEALKTGMATMAWLAYSFLNE